MYTEAEVLKIIKWYKDTISECDASDKEPLQLLSEYKKYRKKFDPKKRKRFTYGTVGYGVMSLLGEFYRMGRIEIYDSESETPFNNGEGVFCLPFEASGQFEDWIMGLSTDMPIQFDIGSVDECRAEVSKKLNIDIDKLNDRETVGKYYKEKYKNIKQKVTEEIAKFKKEKL
jgi:hypothetical protein|tara:strand:- start:120 stop:635 length:516 start_codon:yes stop_codon:yes gene_type:complete